jgi:hypothetical protein
VLPLQRKREQQMVLQVIIEQKQWQWAKSWKDVNGTETGCIETDVIIEGDGLHISIVAICIIEIWFFST